MKNFFSGKYAIYSLFILAIVLIFIYKFLFPAPMSAYSNTDVIMGSNVTVSVYAKNEKSATAVSEDIFKDLHNLDDVISANSKTSELSKLNDESKLENPSKTLLDSLTKSAEFSKKSKGAFNPAIFRITDLWKIGTDDENVPDDKNIKKALKSVDIKNLEIDDDKITLKNNAKLDLGAVGKGIACNYARDYLEKNKISGAVIVGGSVLVYGTQPSKKPYTVEVRNPFGDISDTMGKITLNEGVISTSGSYEKYFERDGKKYHHIFNPKTGYPAKSSLISVTVISDDGFLSDALSTAIFVLDKEDGIKLAKDYNAGIILIDENKKVYVSEDVDFEITNDDFKLVTESEFLKG
jgi:thiamine biosynthesis lipoprotein